MYHKHEQGKRRQYNCEYKRLVETCNVHATNSLDKMRNGLRTATVFYKRLASMIAERRDVLSSLRRWTGFFITLALHFPGSLLCPRGERGHPNIIQLRSLQSTFSSKLYWLIQMHLYWVVFVVAYVLCRFTFYLFLICVCSHHQVMFYEKKAVSSVLTMYTLHAC